MLTRRLVASALMFLLVGPAVGCRSSWWWWNRSAESEAARWPEPSLPTGETPGPPAPATPAGSNPSADAATAAASARPGEQPAAEADSLQSVMAELNELGSRDPEARDRLLADLPKTDPNLWPMLVQQFRAAAAYRRAAVSGAPADARTNDGAEPGGSVAAAAGVPAGAGPTAAGGPFAAGASGGSAVRSASEAMPGGSFGAAAGSPDRLAGTGASGLPPMASPAPAYATRPAVFEQDVAPTNLPPRQASEGMAAAAAAPTVGAVAIVSAHEATARSSGSAGDQAGPNWAALVDFAHEAESRLASTSGSPAEIAAQMRLRLVYLLAGRRDEAMRPIPGLGEAAQQYWSNQVYALATWLDAERRPETSDRAAETQRALDEAMVRLGEAAGLVVRGLAFCTEIQSYGCMTKFKTYEFAPGQPVLLYAEIENFASEATPKGHHTALRSRYQILDSRGQPVADHDFTTTEEYCQNRRRDFFIGYHLQMPDRIYPGRYTLKLAVEDLKSGKLGEGAIEFDIHRDAERPSR